MLKVANLAGKNSLSMEALTATPDTVLCRGAGPLFTCVGVSVTSTGGNKGMQALVARSCLIRNCIFLAYNFNANNPTLKKTRRVEKKLCYFLDKVGFFICSVYF